MRTIQLYDVSLATTVDSPDVIFQMRAPLSVICEVYGFRREAEARILREQAPGSGNYCGVSMMYRGHGLPVLCVTAARAYLDATVRDVSDRSRAYLSGGLR